MVKAAGSMEWRRRTLVALLALIVLVGPVQATFNSSTGLLISCTPNPCQNGGICETDAKTQSKSCSCPESHVGQYCQHQNPCYTGSIVSKRCLNQGKCEVRFPGTSYFSSPSPVSRPEHHCNCRLGFSASLCEIHVPNVCDPSPCQNLGTCSLNQTLTNFVCGCRRGYRGVTCGEVDYCASRPCKNGAQCLSSRSGYTCECAKGFHGATCVEDINECALANVCKNGGTCINTMGSYRCACLPGFSGQDCESLYVPCSPNHCQNGGRCYRNETDRYAAHCDCPSGYTGPACEKNRDDCKGHQCQNGAKCLDGLDAYSCQCKPEYMGVYCTEDVDECSRLPQPCKNGATCQNSRGGYSCICVNGWTGKHCDQNIDDCTPLVCLNGGTCHDRVSSYHCECPPGKTGFQCQLDDACASNPCKAGSLCDTNPTDGSFSCFQCPGGFAGVDCSIDLNECELGRDLCAHDGVCVNTIGSFICNCTDTGYRGARCEENINECASNPCLNDGTCLDERNNYRCVCMPGFTGKECQIDTDECNKGNPNRNPCQNGAVCHDSVNGFHCTCPIGYKGPTCSELESECSLRPCQNGGICHDNPDGTYRCICSSGFGGSSCEANLNKCAAAPCQFGGTCTNAQDGSFSCKCQDGYSGRFCQCSPGSVENGERCEGLKDNRIADVEPGCPAKDCPVKAKNGRCDKECNRVECDYDGQECTAKVDPWANCTLKTSAPCSLWWKNGRCDPECNIQECLYDGFDCGIPIGPCAPDFDSMYGYGNFCIQNYGNGVCDEMCNSKECYFDGLDCNRDPPRVLDGAVILIVNVPPEKFRMAAAPFLQKLGKALRTVALIQKDKNGRDNITPWTLNGGIAIKSDDSTPSGTMGTAIHVQLDNRKCEKDCFETVDAVSRYLTAAEQQGTLDLGYPLYSVQAQAQVADKMKGTSAKDSAQYWLMILIPLCLIMGIVVLIMVMINNKRKRVRATTWFPEGFPKKSGSTTILTPDHIGGFHTNDFRKSSYDNRPDGGTSGSYYDSDGDQPQQPVHKRIKGSTQEEPRAFTQQYTEFRRPADLLAFTPPAHDDSSHLDVNAKGPGGMTPLMLAAMRGDGMDNCEDDGRVPLPDVSDQEMLHIINELLMSGSNLNDVSAVSGETALHYAARHARGVVVKALLENGADVTAKDDEGRTALHAAAAAGSSSVFNVLKTCRKVDWNATTDDGTTPLMLAVRYLWNDIVQAMVNLPEVDVNVADKSGRTAFHWAAAVNNHQAVKFLGYRQGSKVDVQDVSLETPLFLAAKEGNLLAAKELLEFRASMELANDTDQTPRDIAVEKRQTEMVRLLDQQKEHDHSPQFQSFPKNIAYSNQIVQQLPTINRYSKPSQKKSYCNSVSGGSTNLQGLQKKNSASLRRRTPLDLQAVQMQTLRGLASTYDPSSGPRVTYLQSPYGIQNPYQQQQQALADMESAQMQYGNYAPPPSMFGQYPITPAPQAGYGNNQPAVASPAMTLHSNDQTYVSNMSSSPDSPGQWSSSPQSEWSDGTGMPSPRAMMTRMSNVGQVPQGQQQTYLGQYISSTDVNTQQFL
ncbi:Neurogenic locus Notch protein [Hypsibius exemplaris]|uniref:Neurogenic locus Notch protein n=1 Tax=Hypsibius exemplaris TaxID=2072580 RepID=A0A1W0WTD5_HYPEX|nr:Neurogenic locus Notch protein [Hypsibius exemplaris]